MHHQQRYHQQWLAKQQKELRRTKKAGKRTQHKWNKDINFGKICVRCGLHQHVTVLEDGINVVVRTTFPSGRTKTQLGGRLLRGCVGSKYGLFRMFTVKAKKQTMRSKVRVFLYRLSEFTEYMLHQLKIRVVLVGERKMCFRCLKKIETYLYRFCLSKRRLIFTLSSPPFVSEY